MLSDGNIVAVKKSKTLDQGNLEQFLNEIVLLSQINHRNIVRILGVSLESEVPIIVYEFISNGNVFELLHQELDNHRLVTWELRMRIAMDTAGALSYLHSAATSPIYHRDIKSANIMLDESYRAKVSDFGMSRSVTVDQTHLTTVVAGTMGYIDPEYFQSSHYTDKSDVYSFGVVLVELITGENPVSFQRSTGETRTLATFFKLAAKEKRVLEIVDSRIKDDSKLGQVIMMAQLAKQCLSLKGQKRPTMREVCLTLETIFASDGDLQNEVHAMENDEEDDEEEAPGINRFRESLNIDVTAASTSTSPYDVDATSCSDSKAFLPTRTM